MAHALAFGSASRKGQPKQQVRALRGWWEIVATTKRGDKRRRQAQRGPSNVSRASWLGVHAPDEQDHRAVGDSNYDVAVDAESMDHCPP